jgi:hypothetical protein
MNLTVRLQPYSYHDLEGALCPPWTERPFLICDRCHDIEAIVVAIMEILQLEDAWVLCGPCANELPKGFKAV